MRKTLFTQLTRAEEERALELHRKATVIDAKHFIAGWNSPDGEFARARITRFVDNMRKGGITAISTTMSGQNFSQASRSIQMFDRRLSHVRDVVKVLSVKDIERTKREGKIAYILDLQDTLAIERSVDLVDALWIMGLRIMQLTYQEANLVGDGSGSRRSMIAGLTNFGVRIVERMNEVGMLIDLSHSGSKTTMEAIALSKDPVSFTHSGARALHDMVRCKYDDEIKALAEKGGVMGINAIARFVRREGTREGATVEHFLDHIDYVTGLVGVNHVGLGLDVQDFLTREEFQGVHNQNYRRRELDWWTNSINPYGMFPFEHYFCFGVNGCDKVPTITKGLVVRGHSDQEILKILGGNWLRLFQRVWNK